MGSTSQASGIVEGMTLSQSQSLTPPETVQTHILYLASAAAYSVGTEILRGLSRIPEGEVSYIYKGGMVWLLGGASACSGKMAAVV